MQNATNLVVSGKLEPVGKATPVVPVLCTAQFMFERHGRPWAQGTQREANRKAKALLAAAKLGIDAHGAKGQSGLLEYYAALSGMVALARKAAKEATAAHKQQRERDAASIAVFASSIKPIVAAVVFQRMPLAECAKANNYMELLTACRRALEGNAEQGQPPIDFEGHQVANGQAKVEQRLNREAARAAGKAAEKAIVAGMTAKQAADLMSQAQAEAKGNAAAEIREKAVAAGAKFGAGLIERMGQAAALDYLRAAIKAVEEAAPVAVKIK